MCIAFIEYWPRFDGLINCGGNPTKQGYADALNSNIIYEWVPILCPIESVDTLVTFVMKISENSRWFRRRRAVGFDCAFGAIKSNCPSSSKSSRIFRNFHDEGDEGVHTLDETKCTWHTVKLIFDQWLNCSPDPLMNAYNISFVLLQNRATNKVGCPFLFRWS